MRGWQYWYHEYWHRGCLVSNVRGAWDAEKITQLGAFFGSRVVWFETKRTRTSAIQGRRGSRNLVTLTQTNKQTEAAMVRG